MNTEKNSRIVDPLQLEEEMRPKGMSIKNFGSRRNAILLPLILLLLLLFYVLFTGSEPAPSTKTEDRVAANDVSSRTDLAKNIFPPSERSVAPALTEQSDDATKQREQEYAEQIRKLSEIRARMEAEAATKAAQTVKPPATSAANDNNAMIIFRDTPNFTGTDSLKKEETAASVATSLATKSPAHLADMADRLEPATLKGSSASRHSREWLLTRGSMIDCTLQTAVDSTFPGMTTCVTPRVTYSATGEHIVIPRGSKIVGHYDSAKAGEARLFMVWDRIETPDDIFINIGSPTTDALGVNGVAGVVDNRFMQRFGQALLFSALADSVAPILTKLLNENNVASTDATTAAYILTNRNSNTSATQKSALDALLQQNALLPPIIKIRQGENIKIFVARDLDFREANQNTTITAQSGS